MINDFSQFCSQSVWNKKRVFLRVDIYFLNGGVPYIFGVTGSNFGAAPSILGSFNH